ncbi:unnamed protein product [Prunus armeniaca]|uniref:Uncharacterized protein n=1 Tax=Prunus armeniaca TaxID=36596 RepID=A0A6J5WPK6_PRUAR|nr:unnamed protein product [Prunus armeniaca]
MLIFGPRGFEKKGSTCIGVPNGPRPIQFGLSVGLGLLQLVMKALPLKSAVTFSSSKINASSLPEFTLYAHCLGKIVCVCLDSGTT